ncbi:hypothetical protein [uncultured Pyramidobacter sp.]|uniref:hypothetical protein n=1 Tax=uncultured Pyramidobacter sp. TaxID=1623495 RepID=UPI00258B6FE0|nr:hypothetical protein [uncultured Pyramidobacter sp.]
MTSLLNQKIFFGARAERIEILKSKKFYHIVRFNTMKNPRHKIIWTTTAPPAEEIPSVMESRAGAKACIVDNKMFKWQQGYGRGAPGRKISGGRGKTDLHEKTLAEE